MIKVSIIIIIIIIIIGSEQDWIRTRLSFEILKSVHLCTRGSRSPFRAKDEHIDEFKLNSVTAEVF